MQIIDKSSVLQRLQIADLCNRKRNGLVDLQGWNSQNKLLLDQVNALTDPMIIEVGVWKGGSSIGMAQQLAAKKAKGAVVAIDTFLGSSEHYLSFQDLDSVGIGPKDELRLLQIFLDNIAASGTENWIIPLPLDSQSAFELLSNRRLEADLIHIDAGHHYFSVYFDLVSWWSLLKPGCYMVCDDYSSRWPGVVRAVDDFRKLVQSDNFQTDNVKCSFRKTATDFQFVPEVDMNSIVGAHAGAEIEMYQSIVEQLNHKVRQFENSLSWKLTSPLRTISARIRRN